MLPSMSDQMAAVMLDARNFSVNKKIYYIDSLLLLQVLLRRDDFLLPIPEEDRKLLRDRLSAYYWPEINVTPDLEDVPITVELEELLLGASKLKQHAFSGPPLTAEYLMLAMLSVNGPCRHQLEKVGLIFEDYLQALQQQIRLELEEELGEEVQYTLKINMEDAASEPQRDAFREGLTRFFSGKSERRKIAGKYLLIARYYYRFNHLKLCRNYCWYALQASPDITEAYVLCASTWMNERAYDKAYPHLKDALALDADNIDILENMGRCLRQMGAPEEAAKIYHQLPHETDDFYLLNNLGFYYADTGEYEQAISMLDKAIALSNDEYGAFAYNNKGYALMQLGQLEAAREHILKSLSLHKGNAYAYRNLALLYLKENNRVAAKEALLQAKRFRFAANYGPEVDELLTTLE